MGKEVEWLWTDMEADKNATKERQKEDAT